MLTVYSSLAFQTVLWCHIWILQHKPNQVTRSRSLPEDSSKTLWILPVYLVFTPKHYLSVVPQSVHLPITVVYWSFILPFKFKRGLHVADFPADSSIWTQKARRPTSFSWKWDLHTCSITGFSSESVGRECSSGRTDIRFHSSDAGSACLSTCGWLKEKKESVENRYFIWKVYLLFSFLC